MINSTLIEILRSFTKEEIKEFDRLVSSDYFNRKSAVLKLWKVVSDQAPVFNSHELTREKIYADIFPGKPFNYGTMKNLVHDLTKLAEKFIELKVYSEKPSKISENLLEAFLERGLGDQFEKNIRSIEKLHSVEKEDTNYHETKYILEVLKQNHLIQQDKFYQTGENIKAANEYLTMGYFINVFVNNYNSLYMQNEISGNYKNDFVRKVLEFLKSAPVEMDYMVNIYYNAFMLVYDGCLQFFYELRKLLEENINNLGSEHKYNFFVALANYCVKKADEGLYEFTKTEYQIYRFMIDNNIYSIDRVKNIDGAFYKNVSGTAVNAGEFEWAKYFIEKYKDMLEPDVRENYYFHALIEYYIKLKNFGRAQGYLSRIKHTNYSSKLNIKGWEIITAYELDHLEELRYLIDSARHFIQNDKKIFPSKLERLSNFISIVTKLVYIKENPESIKLINRELITLKEDLNKLKCFHKIWLEEKIEELNQ
ncbi:MAG: hypothetical protein ABI543_13570 [Ignavibacteria bacterium]